MGTIKKRYKMASKAEEYDSSEIRVLEGLEPVRL